MSSSIGHAHWTVELECDSLFIMKGQAAKNSDETKELKLTESEQTGSWSGGRGLSCRKITIVVSRLDHTP
jgi:hypothetical protein